MINFSKLILLIFFAHITSYSRAQVINYTFRNYTIKDGLAGNQVYCATQDKEGFIWFGTETGLSRFDGTHFKNYSVADGLPDNEILNIFTDSKGRVWLVPFKKSIAYIYHGKLFNSFNDKVVNKIEIVGSCYNIIEDSSNNIIILDSKAINIINSNGSISKIFADSVDINLDFRSIVKSSSGAIYIIEKRKIFKLINQKLKEIFILPKNYNDFSVNKILVNDSLVFLPNSFESDVSRFTVVTFYFNSKIKKVYPIPQLSSTIELKDDKIYSTSSSGVNILDANSKSLLFTININKPINRSFLDKDGNIYLLTTNSGIFIKKNSSMMYKNFINNGREDLAVDYINATKNSLLIGASNNNPIIMDRTDINKVKYLSSLDFEGSFGKNVTPICYMAETKSGQIQVANTEGFFLANKSQWKSLRTSLSIKKLVETEINYLMCTSGKLLLVDKINLKTIDTIWHERTTTVNFFNNNYYIGTINGLYKLTQNKISTYLGDSIPIFQRRISAIKKGTDGTIWVGTYDAGVVAYKNGKVLQVFNDSNGLTSNICRNLFINGNYLWVGTDKGLNKIDISKPPYKIVINYTTTDGLASNMINAVYTDSNMVYVGTPDGLTFFDETKIVNNSTCDMRILGVTISGKEQQWDSSKIIIKHEDNNIRFDFVALSFKSAGDISYRYKLVGLDKEWKTTRENYLSYPSLPSGNYTLEIEATNKFGVKSGIIKVDVEIEKLLVEKIWFKLLLLFTGLALVYWYFNNKIRKEKKKVNEQIAYNEKINDMEQMALKAQMNPHFIFNCLNSIQEFVITGDVQGANKFITDFSKLIRGTLDNSSKKVISIDDEVKYLTNYLLLEQYRFENKFLFNILIDKSINVFDTYIPPMLMQPYLENAIRHGINNKKEGKGLIQVNIVKLNNNLVCEIIDNGIGIVASQKLKGDTSIEYQSKGMSLTAKRIQLLNKDVAENIVVKVEDVPLPQMGTRVTITIPNI